MQKSNAPAQYVIPWANAGTKNTIPIASQIGITNGAASFTDGYPPLTFTPIASGGVPPFGSDTNGILYDETLNTLWQQSGFHYAFNSTFNTNQGGYPAQALLARSDGKGLWLNLSDNNTTNPDATGQSGWASVRANIGSTTIAVVVGNNTPDPSTLGPRLLIITGSIASTASLILPLTAGASWTIQNNTSGAGSLSVQGATGSGVTVAQGTTSDVITDGTNFYTSTFNGAGVYLPIGGTAVAATKLATARTIAMTGDVSWTSPAFDGTANISAVGTIALGAVTLAKMATFQANSLMGNPTGGTATPQAITLTSGIQFAGTTLSLGAITPASVATSGSITYNGNLIASGSTSIISNTSPGFIYIRPQGSTVGQTFIDGSGNMVVYGSITMNGNILSSGSAMIIANNSAGTIYFRSSGSATGQMTLDGTGNLFVGGNITSTGTINFATSDATLKNLGDPIEPKTFHRLPYYAYTRSDTGAKGWGPTAQSAREIEPAYVREYDHVMPDGSIVHKLNMAKEQMTQDTAYWAARRVDELLERVGHIERFMGLQ